MDAARHWAAGGRWVDAKDELAADIAAFGLDPEALQEQLDDQEGANDEDFGVYEKNAPAVTLFMACSTQWRVGAGGAPIGLDYTAVDHVIERLNLECDPDIFAGVQLMERAAVKEMLERLDS